MASIKVKSGPKHVNYKGIPCTRIGTPMQLQGQTFDTYQPDSDEDDRLFERSRETGFFIQTR